MAGTWGREEKKGNKGVQVRDIQRCRGKPRADQRASDPLRKGEDTNGGVWRPGRGAQPALPGLTGDNSRREGLLAVSVASWLVFCGLRKSGSAASRLSPGEEGRQEVWKGSQAQPSPHFLVVFYI